MSKLTESERFVLESIQELHIRLRELEDWKSEKIEHEKKAMEYLEELAKYGDIR